MYKKRFPWLWLCMGLALAACSGSGPQLIGAQPKPIGSSGFAPPPSWPIVYNAYMELEVADVGVAMQAAAQLARNYGGYTPDGAGWDTVTLVVPAAQFDGAHNGVLSLGRLRREDISGEPLGGRPGEGRAGAYSQITAHFVLASGYAGWPPAPSGWNPARTVAQAWTWFVSMFTFLADFAIWVLVVGGPFVLMGWGGVALVRRLRGKR